MRLLPLAALAALAAALAAAPRAQPVYATDFEADAGGWSGTGDWAWGEVAATPSTAGCFSNGAPFPSGAASGVRAWATDLAGCHAPGQDARLTRTFDLSAAAAPLALCWTQWIDAGGNDFDRATVLVGGVEAYVGSGSSGGVYETVCLDVSGAAGQAAVEVAFRFVATAQVERAGWYVDDVTLGAPVVAAADGPRVGASALSAVAPNPLRGRGRVALAVDQTQRVAVELVNVLGQRVATLFDGTAVAGQSLALAVDARGLPAGVYVVRATGATVRASVRVTVL